MAQAPVMPLWTDALLGDCQHLSIEQFGAYLMLLIVEWRANGKPLPDDDRRLARICRVSVTVWRKKFRPVLQEFFDVRDGFWHQKRLELEWQRVADVLSKRRTSAAAGGRATAASKRDATSAPIHEPDISPPRSPPLREGDFADAKIEKSRKKPPRRAAVGNGAVPEHRSSYRPLRDPVEIAKERGLRK